MVWEILYTIYSSYCIHILRYKIHFFLCSSLPFFLLKSGISYVHVRGVESKGSQLWWKSIFYANFRLFHPDVEITLGPSMQCAVSFFPYITCRLFSQQTYSSGLRKREREREKGRREAHERASSGFKPMYVGKQGFCDLCLFLDNSFFLNLHIRTWKERHTWKREHIP